MKNLVKILFLLIPVLSFAQNGTGFFGKIGVNVGTTTPTERVKIGGSMTVTGALKFQNYGTGVLKTNSSGEVNSAAIVNSDISTSAAIDYTKITGLTVNNVAALKLKTGTYNGQLATLLGYYNYADGGEGDFYWNSTSTATDNGGTIIQVTGVSTGRWIRIVNNNKVYIKWFGAVGGGTEDATLQVQKAADYAKNGKILVFDDVYGVSSTINISANTYFSIASDNAGYATAGLKALSSMNYLVSLKNTSGFAGRILIDKIYLNCNNLSGGIDATSLRYSTISNNYIFNIAASKKGLSVGGWVNRIINNEITNTTNVGVGISIEKPEGVSFANSLNNLVIDKNSITGVEYGLYSNISNSDVSHNNTVISNNTFDAISKAAIYVFGYTRGFIVENNYFEGSSSIASPVETSSGVFENRFGVIVLARKWNVIIGHNGVVIQNNHFANCLQSATSTSRNIISADYLSSAEISNNSIYPDASTYESLVAFSGAGVQYTDASNIYIQHDDIYEKINILVKNLTGNTALYCGFKAVHNKQVPFIYPVPNIFQDFTGWTGSATITKNFSNGVERTSVSGTSINKVNVITGSKIRPFLGKYIRFTGVVVPVSPATNGLAFSVEIDTGAGYTTALSVSATTSTFRNLTNSQIVYIPANAVNLRITINPVVSGEVVVENFRLEEAK